MPATGEPRMLHRPLLLAVLLTSALLAGCTQPTGPANTPGGGSTGTGITTSCGGAMGGNASTMQVADGDRMERLGLPARLAAQATGTGLVIGTFLPLTGSLSAYGGDMQNATEMARDEINAAGGVNGAPVTLQHQDDKSSDTAGAPQTFQAFVSAHAAGVVGGAASSITGAVLDSAKTNHVVVVTPASTSPALTDASHDNQGFFLRIPPSDALQGKVLARVVHDDGCRTVTLLEVNNPYGVGLGGVFRATFTAMGGQVKDELKFDENAQSFTTEVQRAGNDASDAVVLVGYPGQATPIMQQAYTRGVMGKSVFFFSEGVKDAKFVTGTGKASGGSFILQDLRGTAPGSVTSGGFAHFNSSFSAKYGHAPGLFAAESYDATWMIALAAQCGGANTGDAVKANILKVGNKDGATDVPVSGGNAQVALTTAGAPTHLCNLDYQGAAHDFNFDAKGDPTDGVYTVWKVASDGSIQTVQDNLRP
ncbi:MAG: ABC transporter substrate-binding protein [Halobacteriales archaeon]|nr:ABC transporter substrate-binding protein [Halobacteriales archaeon]